MLWLLAARSVCAGTQTGAASSTTAGLEATALARVSLQGRSSPAARSAFQPGHGATLTTLIFHEYQLPFVLFLLF